MCTFFVDIAIMVMDHCLHTKNATHDEDHEIIFDCSLFENKDSNKNKCCRGFPCTCVCNLVQNKCEASFFSGKGFYDSFEKENHPLYLVVYFIQISIFLHYRSKKIDGFLKAIFI